MIVSQIQTRTYRNQRGFGHVAVIALVLVVGVVGLIGYKVATTSSSAKDQAMTFQPPAAKTTVAAPQVKTVGDIDKASSALDQNDPSVSNSDLTALDAQTSALN